MFPFLPLQESPPPPPRSPNMVKDSHKGIYSKGGFIARGAFLHATPKTNRTDILSFHREMISLDVVFRIGHIQLKSFGDRYYLFDTYNMGIQRICSSKYLFLWNLWLASKEKKQINSLFINCWQFTWNIRTFIKRSYKSIWMKHFDMNI